MSVQTVAEKRAKLPDFFLTVTEAAQVMSCSPKTIQRLVKEERLRVDGYVRQSKRFKYSRIMDMVEKGF